MTKMVEIEGNCPRCGRIHQLRSPRDIVVCDCWSYCPLCGAEMEPYKPDAAPKTYALNRVRELRTLMVCNRHHPPFFSQQKPVEVTC